MKTWLKILIILLILIVLGFSVREYSIYQKSKESNIALDKSLRCLLECEDLINLTTGKEYLDPECFEGCKNLTLGSYNPPKRYNGFNSLSNAESCKIGEPRTNRTLEQRNMCLRDFLTELEKDFRYLQEE